MITALATVSHVEHRQSEYQVTLACEQKTSCQSCQSSSSCGTGIVSKAIGKKVLSWSLSTQTPVQSGQIVEVGFPEQNLLHSAVILYLLPLVMLMVGACLGSLWLSPLLDTGEVPTILAAMAGLGSGLGMAKFFSHQLEQQSANAVVILRVLGQPLTVNPLSKG